MSNGFAQKVLSFSNDYIETKWVSTSESLHIGPQKTTVVNLGAKDLRVHSDPEFTLAPMWSTILQNVRLTGAESVLLITVNKTENLRNIVTENGWVHLSGTLTVLVCGLVCLVRCFLNSDFYH